MEKRRFVRKTSDGVVLGGLVLLFGYFFLFHEMRELGDSYQYLHQFVSREPVYALLLKGIQILFGENYGMPLSFFQNILAVVCTYWLYYRITEDFSFPPILEIGIGAILASPHILTPLASKTRMIITNSVLTEGVAFSLYYLWAGIMLSVLLNKRTKKQPMEMIISLLLSLMLSMIRGQMMICLIVWCMVCIYITIRNRQYKRIALILLGVLLCFVGKTQLTKSYNLKESGIYVNTVSGNPMMLANALYLAEIEDGEGIKDPKLKTAYENMIIQVKEQKLSIEHGEGNIIEKAKFHEYGHETINFDIIVPNLNGYIKEKDGIDESQYSLLLVKQDEYAKDIFKAILPHILPAYLQNYFVISSLGLVRSVAVELAFLPLFACTMYILAIGLSVYLFWKNSRSEGANFMFFILLCIAGTVFGTSLMIQCISRYMLYNLPLFYIAGLVMVLEVFREKAKSKG